MNITLIVEEGPSAGRRFVIRPGQRFEIGRAGVSVSLIEDSTVSRKHAQIELTAEGRLLVADLNSRNGTSLNDRVLTPYTPTEVRADSVIQVGKHFLRVLFNEDDDDTRRARARLRKRDEPRLLGNDIRITGRLGSGANGRVYSAFQTLMNRRVAVKCLHTRGDDESSQRFLQEGRMACRVRSPYVVEVYDFRVSADGEDVYLIMELVDGVTLHDRFKLGPPLTIPEALLIGEQIALGLAAVHLEGVIHRDIKPTNILIGPSGISKLSDFGIARDLLAKTALTPDDVGFGSIPYVSPEQARQASAAGPRSDLFSLGATLYHAIGGRLLRQDRGEGLWKTLNSKHVPLADLAPGCPRQVCLLVEALLEEDPEQRPSSAEEVARQLAALRENCYPEDDESRRAALTRTDRFDALPSARPEPDRTASSLPSRKPARPSKWGGAVSGPGKISSQIEDSPVS